MTSPATPADAYPPAPLNAAPAGWPARWPRACAGVLLGLATASGFAALVYEVCWLERLKLILGTTATATAATLATFMIGLGAGAWLGGRWARRTADAWAVYALVEGLAAILAVGFLLGFSRGPDYGAAVAALALMAGCAVLLGATFPLLIAARGASTPGRAARGWAGWVYALNTLGAVGGVVFAGFVGQESWGTLGATRLAIAVQMGGAAVAFLSSGRARAWLGRFRRRCSDAPPAETPAETPDVRRAVVPAVPGACDAVAPETPAGHADGHALEAAAVRRWYQNAAHFAAACTGFATLGAEIVWTRLLAFVLPAHTYAFAAMLAVYLAGVALGALVGSALVRRCAARTLVVVFLPLAAGSLVLTWLPGPLGIPDLYARLSALSTGFDLNTRADFVALLLLGAAQVLLLPTFLFGLAFPAVLELARGPRDCRAGGDAGRSAGLVYAVNVIAGGAGALLVGLVVIPALGTQAAFAVCAGVAWLAVLPALVLDRLAGGTALEPAGGLRLGVRLQTPAHGAARVSKRNHEAHANLQDQLPRGRGSDSLSDAPHDHPSDANSDCAPCDSPNVEPPSDRRARCRRFGVWLGRAGVGLVFVAGAWALSTRAPDARAWITRSRVFATVAPGSPLPAGAHRALVDVAEDREGIASVVVDYWRAERHIYIGDFAAAQVAPTAAYMPMMGHLPMLARPGAERVLVICYGTGATAAATAAYRPARLDLVEISPAVLELAERYFADVGRGVTRADFARLHVADGRQFLLDAPPESYDVITLEPLLPHTPGAIGLYTREFYELARARLAPQGVLCQWLPIHATSPASVRALAATFAAVFPEAELWYFEQSALLLSAPMSGGVPAGVAKTLPAEATRALARAGVTPATLDAARVGPVPAGWGAMVTDEYPRLPFVEILPPKGTRRDFLVANLEALRAVDARPERTAPLWRARIALAEGDPARAAALVAPLVASLVAAGGEGPSPARTIAARAAYAIALAAGAQAMRDAQRASSAGLQRRFLAEAQACYEAASAKRPELPEPYWRAARAAALRGDRQAARRLRSAAVNRCPPLAQARFP